MGEVVYPAAFRIDRGPAAPPAVDPARPDLVKACRGFAAGFRQMRAASSLLAEATAELRAFAREQAEG